jgi:hypothetical protein
LQVLLATEEAKLSLMRMFCTGTSDGSPVNGWMTALEAYSFLPNVALPLRTPWSVFTLPSHSSLAKGINYVAVSWEVQQQRFQPSSSKVGGALPIVSKNFRGFPQFVGANTGIIFR